MGFDTDFSGGIDRRPTEAYMTVKPSRQLGEDLVGLNPRSFSLTCAAKSFTERFTGFLPHYSVSRSRSFRRK